MFRFYCIFRRLLFIILCSDYVWLLTRIFAARHRYDVSLELCCPGFSRRVGPCHSLHASAYYCEYNKDMILDFLNFIPGTVVNVESGMDFKWSLSQLREVHLRRYNLRASALELFLIDQTNYFINFTEPSLRLAVYKALLNVRPPNLLYYGMRTPQTLLKVSILLFCTVSSVSSPWPLKGFD